MAELSDAEKAQALAELKRRFGNIPEQELEKALEGRSFTVPRSAVRKPGGMGIESVSDLEDCNATAANVYQVAKDAAARLENKVARFVAQTAADIAYAVAKEYCRAEYG